MWWAILRVLEGTEVPRYASRFLFFTTIRMMRHRWPNRLAVRIRASRGCNANRHVAREVSNIWNEVLTGERREQTGSKEGKARRRFPLGYEENGRLPTALNRFAMRQVPALRKPRSPSARHPRFCTDRSSLSCPFPPRYGNTRH